ncbi:MAG: ankyrin repeat domain-containing protein [Lentisphaerae bacterium]|nr:ankyrin repeat domain-containing protein [Lentisphaerota bacterium]
MFGIRESIDKKSIAVAAVVFTAITLVAFGFPRFGPSGRAIAAAKQGRLATMAALLKSRPELVNARDKKKLTPLHWAVLNRHANMVDFLLDHGANVNATDKYGMTPLHMAALWNLTDIAGRLLRTGANPDLKGIRYNSILVTPLHEAAAAGHPAMIDLLADNGADVNEPTGGDNRVMPLHMAAARGQYEAVKMLIAHDAEVNARDTNGKTPLTWARESDQDDAADLLILYGGTK